MQNRIEKLIEICTERVPYYPAGNDGHPEYNIAFNKQKFAELLIKECIAQVKEALPDTNCSASGAYKTAKLAVIARIEDHFEIKE